MTAKLAGRVEHPGGARRRRGRDTRRQILDACLHLFSQRGFARTTVRDIARQAGITDAAIYYHFASKQDLLEALFVEKGIVPALEELERAPGELPPREALLAIAQRAMALMEANREFLRLVFMEALGSEPGAVSEYRSVMQRWERGVSRLLKTYIQRGELQPLDTDLTARQMVSGVFMAFLDDLLGRFGSFEGGEGELNPALLAYMAAALDNNLSGMLAPASYKASGE